MLWKQWVLTGLVLVAMVSLSGADDDKKEKKKKLQIGIKKRVDPEKCRIKTKRGDTLHMHYTVCSHCKQLGCLLIGVSAAIPTYPLHHTFF